MAKIVLYEASAMFDSLRGPNGISRREVFVYGEFNSNTPINGVGRRCYALYKLRLPSWCDFWDAVKCKQCLMEDYLSAHK